ncbi:MAG: hypothetical protein IJR57_06395 [Ruminococcus sp.]|nr:hypothetical protein [Ruminococcus sp.]
MQAAFFGARLCCALFYLMGLFLVSMDFEKSFSDYLDRKEYDEAEQALFAAVRSAYKAGWDAAGGDPPKPQGILHIVSNQNNKSGGRND